MSDVTWGGPSVCPLSPRAARWTADSLPRDILLQCDSASGIGKSRITQLASFGIESAGNIDRDAIMQAPGFEPQLASRPCIWRVDLEQWSRFDPATPMRRCGRDLKTPLAHFQVEPKESARQVQVQERRLATMTARLSAHDGAVATAVTAAAAARTGGGGVTINAGRGRRHHPGSA